MTSLASLNAGYARHSEVAVNDVILLHAAAGKQRCHLTEQGFTHPRTDPMIKRRAALQWNESSCVVVQKSRVGKKKPSNVIVMSANDVSTVMTIAPTLA